MSALPLFGTVLNLIAILLGGLAGLLFKLNPSEKAQTSLRLWIGVFTVFAGLHLFWVHLKGGFLACVGQALLGFVALSLGHLLGKAAGLQKLSNQLGQYAGKVVSRMGTGDKISGSEAFLACAAVFCASPMAPLGSLQEGLTGDWRSFAIKAVVDGLAAMSFAAWFGWKFFWVLLPIAAWQGSLALAAGALAPWAASRDILHIILATSGLLLCCVSALILQTQKVRVADYLPSLVVAPVLLGIWRAIFG